MVLNYFNADGDVLLTIGHCISVRNNLPCR
jgi:hypothetical protein